MINILINLEFIHPASPFYKKIVEPKEKSAVNNRDEIRVANFNRTLICSAEPNSFVWIVTDRSEVITDIDGNGLNDIPFTNPNPNFEYFRGRAWVAFQVSEGIFQCVAVSDTHSLPYGISVGDFNGDNRPDLVFAGAYHKRILTLINNGGQNFIEQQVSSGIGSPNHIAVRNADAGNSSEIVFTDEAYRLYIYNFMNNTTNIINYECMEGLSLADLNNDNTQDVVCGTSNAITPGYLKYQLNQGNNWSQIYNVSNIYTRWHGITTADFNEDGRIDIAACVPFDNMVYIFYNNGGNPPTFTLVASVLAANFDTCELTAVDIDCDDDYDIVWSRGWGGVGPSVGYLQNPTWTNYIIENERFVTYGIAVGYVNSDNRPDVVIGLNNELYVYYNNLCSTTPIDIRENKEVNYKIVSDRNKVKILFNTPISGRVNVYSLDGNKIVSKEFNGREVNLSLKKGLYIISINSNLLSKKEKLAIY